MRKSGIAIGFAFCLLAGTVRAEPVSLSIGQVVTLANALNALDGYDRVVKEGQAERAIRASYVLSGEARQIIAANLRRLKEIVADFQTARQGKVMEMSHGEAIKPGSDVEQRLALELSKMLDAKTSVELTRLKTKDLGLDANPIPPSVLADLGLVLDDTPK